MFSSKSMAVFSSVILLLSVTLVSFQPVFAEQTTSINKSRPQANEIQAKVKTMLEAQKQKRLSDKMILEYMQQTAKFMRENSNKTSIEDRTTMQKSMIKQALDEKYQEFKIREEIAKRDKVKKMAIDKLVNSGLVKMGSKEKTQIEYGKTLEDLKKSK